MKTAIPNVAETLSLQLEDGDATKFPQANIRNSAGGAVGAAIDLTHVANGLYQGSATFTTEDEFDVTFITYNEVGHTTESAAHLRAVDRYKVEIPRDIYRGAIWVDSTNGTNPATPLPGVHGTPDNPVNNMADARTLADDAALNYREFRLRGNATIALDQAYNNDFAFKAWTEGTMGDVPVDLASQSISNSTFVGLLISDTEGAGGTAEHADVTFVDCVFGELAAFGGNFIRTSWLGCEFRGTYLAPRDCRFINCRSGADPSTSFDGENGLYLFSIAASSPTNHPIYISDFSGDITVAGYNFENDNWFMYNVQGVVRFASSNAFLGTNTIELTGAGRLEGPGIPSASVLDATGFRLPQDHTFRDNTVYDGSSRLTDARERVFLTAAAANAATDGGSGEGEIITYTLNWTYDAAGLATMTRTRA